MIDKPNIIIIMADDLGHGDLSVFNHGITNTHAIDRLVDEGTCLSQHYSGSCVCGPARASLLTGRHAIRAGMLDLGTACGRDQLLPNEITLAAEFKRLGYTTGLMGKWHCGSRTEYNHPNARGFDQFVGFRAGTWDYYDLPIDHNGQWQEPNGQHMTDIISDASVDFVKANKGKPFFLHIAHHAPHHPLQVPDQWADPYRKQGTMSEGLCRLYGMIDQMDHGITRLLDELDRSGLTDNTIVIFTSDNGPQFSEFEEFGSTHRFNCGYRGSKGMMYEGGIRVPLIIRWPDGTERISAHHEMTHFTDWLPTLLAAAGASPTTEKQLEGQSILPMLQGNPQNICDSHFWQWTWHTPTARQCAALREGDWKLVRPTHVQAMGFPYDSEAGQLDLAMHLHPEQYSDDDLLGWKSPAPTAPMKNPLLFNIALDPLEQDNLADKHPEILARLSHELDNRFDQAIADLNDATDGALP